MGRRTVSFLSMHSKFGFAHTFSILDRGHLFNQENVASHNTTNIGWLQNLPTILGCSHTYYDQEIRKPNFLEVYIVVGFIII